MDYSLEIKKEVADFFPKFLQSRILLYFVILLLILKISAVLVVINFPHNIFFADITESMLEFMANQAREANGLPPLIKNDKLDNAARMKAENMVQNNYFDHISPAGTTPWHWFSMAGYAYKYAGENLAIGFFESREVFDAWLGSPSHKANILSPNYKEVGTAVLPGFGPNKAVVVVQEFGASNAGKAIIPQTQTPAPADAPAEIAPEPEPFSEPEQAEIASEKVLSQTVESQQLFVFDYAQLIQSAVYGASLILMGMLLIIIFLDIESVFKKQFIIRAVVIMLLLLTAAAINKEAIISLIPHKIII